MTDIITLWAEMDVPAWEASRPPRARVMTDAAERAKHIQLYWQAPDIAFEREFACFWPERKAAA